MWLEFHNKFGELQRVEATRLIAYDELHNPIVVAVEWQQGMYFVTYPGMADFNAVLHNLGLDKTVICTEINETPIDQVRFDQAPAFS